jgi:drug/metabolite transporter (DMT)-like permease
MVALAAALWGTDALLRLPLTGTYSAGTIVFVEHLIIVAVTLPWLVPALRAFAAAHARTRVAVVVIGAGASALATVLFTQAFAYGDPVTPVVLQKLQPLVAILVAAVLLGERVTRRFPLFAVPALAGAWLLAFPDPLAVTVSGVQGALLALSAAALWGTGTVLGRYAGAQIGFRDLTVLRFAFGLPASLVLVLLLDQPLTVPWRDAPVVALLALVPGLLALILFYRGLRGTPASRATLAELAFPFTAALVGVAFLGAVLTGSQWLGLAVLATTVTALALHERLSSSPAVATPSAVDEAVPV